MSLAEHYVAEMRRIFGEAAETDYVMPLWLPFLPLILSLVGFFTLVVSAFGGIAVLLAALWLLLLLVFAGALIHVYVLYKWISRRNNHFRRTGSFYETLVSTLESMGVADPEVVQIRGRVQEMRYEERERGAALWIVLSLLLPIVVFYVYHFLNKDFRRHELREVFVHESLARILERRGVASPRFEPRVPDRSTVLYVVLTLLTIGFFGLYWVYTLAKDPNEHFKVHRVVEESTVRALEQLAKARVGP